MNVAYYPCVYFFYGCAYFNAIVRGILLLLGELLVLDFTKGSTGTNEALNHVGDFQRSKRIDATPVVPDIPPSKQESGGTITGTACVNRWSLPAKAYVVHFDVGSDTTTKSNH